MIELIPTPHTLPILDSLGIEVRRAKAASNAWDDMAAATLTGEGFAEASARFWRLNAQFSIADERRERVA